MEAKKITRNGLVVFLVTLLGFGGGLTLSPDEFDNAYVCSITGEVYDVPTFTRLSSSEKTLYYLDDDGDEQRIGCREGRTYDVWYKLSDKISYQDHDPMWEDSIIGGEENSVNVRQPANPSYRCRAEKEGGCIPQ